MRDLAYDLADHVAKVRYRNLPSEVVGITKKFILDTLGTSLAGSGAPGCEAVARVMSADGGAEQSTLLVFGNRLPAASAALVNGTLAHAVEFDDTHDATTVHANGCTVPAALAMAERKGGVSGKTLIEAVAIGVDVTCRLGQGIDGAVAWTPASVFGCFGAAAAAGRIMGFDAERVHDAMGIAYSQSAGNRQCNVDRALVKRMQLGFPARAGVLSCQLAEAGITGARNIFDGVVGMGNLYFGGKFRREEVVKELGERFLGAELSIKPYPSARPTHAAIDAALALAETGRFRLEDIDEVSVHVTYLMRRTCGAPFDVKGISQVAAQFSIPYTVAVAIARGGVFLDDFVEDNIRRDAQVLALSQKVRVVHDQEPVGPGLTPAVVEIRTKRGDVFSKRTDLIKGNPENPLTFDWVEEKFRRCARFAAKPIAEDKLDRIIGTVRELEALEDVGVLVKLMS